MNKPERSPAKPARLPATERSWQGLPPMITLTGSTSQPFILVMSPRCFMGYLLKLFFLKTLLKIKNCIILLKRYP